MQITTLRLEQLVRERRAERARTGLDRPQDRWRDPREIDRLVRELYDRKAPRS
jgi:hypothetical protein